MLPLSTVSQAIGGLVSLPTSAFNEKLSRDGAADWEARADSATEIARQGLPVPVNAAVLGGSCFPDFTRTCSAPPGTFPTANFESTETLCAEAATAILQMTVKSKILFIGRTRSGLLYAAELDYSAYGY